MMSPFAFGTPAPSLEGLVERYIGYSVTGVQGGIHRGLPSRHPTFIVGIGEPIDVILQTDRRQTPARYRTVISGFQTTHALIAHGCHQEGIAFELTPLGFRTLFGLPVAELWDTTLELSEIAGSAADELWERVQHPAGWDERFAVCDEILGRVPGEIRFRVELENAWRLLVETGGKASVDWVASQVGWSRQALGRRFREEFGLSPKLAARLIRFERANQMLGGIDGPSIAEVATTCGYFDQAHMNRDFVQFAGLAPGQLRVEQEVPSFQDSAPVPA